MYLWPNFILKCLPRTSMSSRRAEDDVGEVKEELEHAEGTLKERPVIDVKEVQEICWHKDLGKENTVELFFVSTLNKIWRKRQ
ncbi:hypothetical protein B9Z55_026327 [Caenorhabditis nigoni]|uniref:Uncharacterized protein n=1 Tax=Caenorhabditis nigoni TaxID=1611254 RepID=A0A2G5T2Z2_9PELO|nr:hypothetical protein B9Z55_026327 [Caenorhabditis nigoni]